MNYLKFDFLVYICMVYVCVKYFNVIEYFVYNWKLKYELGLFY